MSLVNLAHVCSHLQNASKARLSITSIPHTQLHFSLARELHKQGFISTLVLGGLEPPEPSPLLATPSNVEVPTSPSQQRLWLGLKYWNNEPVLSNMRLISKPKRRIWMGNEDLGKLMRGYRAGYVKGLGEIGECMFVTTDRGIMELREAVERGLGGMLLCRAH